MATTTTTAAVPSIDLQTSSSLPIRLGASLLQPTRASTFTSVRYNHKPRAGSVVRHEKENGTGSSIPRDRVGKLAVQDGISRLTLQDGGADYLYRGLHREDKDGYVLLLRGEGKDREMVLERVSSSHAVNLARTPSETDAQTLADLFPHISLDSEEDAQDLFGEDNDADDPVDPLNPFDYRHFLVGGSQGPGAAGTSIVPTRASTVARIDSPVVASAKRTAPAALQTKKRKTATSAKDISNTKRVKTGGQSTTATTSKMQRASQPEPPKIRLDRKASLRNSTIDVEDSGELILEDEDAPPTSRANAMSLALSGKLGGGPISLRSAASSPAASRPTSPPGLPADGEEVDLDAEASDDDDADERSVGPSRQPVTTYHFDPLDGEDDEADADVEDLELPSPAQAHKPSVSAATVTSAVAGEDEDDLGEALALALGEDDDGAVPPPPLQESDEESEEE